ncbi:MAG: CoA pyrophosphatase [Planctomycetota bacterium]
MSPADAAFAELGARLRGLPRRRSRADLRQAAVLVPLSWRDGELWVTLIRRPDTMSTHSGQVACPGGRVDPGETSQEAALRETHEELGLPGERIELLGALHDVEVLVSRHVVTPWVGRIPAEAELIPNPLEVERVFSVPLSALADAERSGFQLRQVSHHGRSYEVPAWTYADEFIWGATGRMLLDLLRLLDRAPTPR